MDFGLMQIGDEWIRGETQGFGLSDHVFAMVDDMMRAKLLAPCDRFRSRSGRDDGESGITGERNERRTDATRAIDDQNRLAVILAIGAHAHAFEEQLPCSDADQR